MAQSREIVFESGPWRGSLRASEINLDSPQLARLMVDGYLPDPAMTSGFYSRPGILAASGATVTTTGPGQCVFSCTVQGVHYNFVFVNGAMYRWSTGLTGAPTNVTPANIIIAQTKFIYVALLNDSLVINDGVNKPWIATNLGGTPVTGTVIEYRTPATLLSRGAFDPDYALASFSFTRRAGGSIGEQTTRAASSSASFGSLGANGTIPTNLWGSLLFELNTSTNAIVITPATGNSAGYASESAAIAGLPARTATNWYLGYMTVRASSGASWTAGTNALAGGGGSNPAQTTNYYPGEGEAWSAFGAPCVYTGAMFLILNKVAGVFARTGLTWSEPNQPSVGYQQSSYDNQWTLTQTGSSPINALVATNEALYYARDLSWGALTGAPNVNFQNTATHDVVSGNVGCTMPATVHRYLNWIYFADQNGRPWRMPIGGSPEPIWTQAREIFEDSAVFVRNAAIARSGWAILEPNLNLYICGTVPTTATVPDIPLVFDAKTGAFMGFWRIGNAAPQDIAGVVLDTDGLPSAVFLEPANTGHATTLVIQRLTRVGEDVWMDTASVGPQFGLQMRWAGYGAYRFYRPTKITALMEYGNAQTPPAMSASLQTTAGAITLAARTPVAIGTGVDGVGRYVWAMDSNVGGRALRAQVNVTDALTAQLKLYQLTVAAVESSAGIDER